MPRAVLEPLTPATNDAARAYLARRPFDNVYLHWLVATGRVGPHDCAVARRPDGTVTGVCLFGSHLVPCADDDATVDLFATLARRVPVPRMIVGPRHEVERLWGALRRHFPRPEASRASQPVYALEPERLRGGGDDDPAVARASLAELDEIAAHASEMIGGETGRAPDPHDPAFRARTSRLIEAGWWWRYRPGDGIAFQCNVGSASPYTAQLQGVWTPPALRGAGRATYALASICRLLLREHPTLSLYVNDFNRAAIALYERVGFRRVGEFQTLFF